MGSSYQEIMGGAYKGVEGLTLTLTLMPSKRDSARSGRSARNVRKDLMAAKSE